MLRTRARMTAYKKASPGMTVGVTGRNILPVDGFGTIEMNLDQPGNTTKLARIGAVVCVPWLSMNLLSTLKAAEQWGKPLIYYKTKAILRFPGEKSRVFNLCPRKGLYSATGVRGIPGQVVALEASIGEAGSAKTSTGAALVVAAKKDTPHACVTERRHNAGNG